MGAGVLYFRTAAGTIDRGRWVMGRLRLSVAALIVVLCLPAISAGQWLPSFQPLGVADLGNVQVSTSARFGYQHMGVNLNLPVPFSDLLGLELFSTSTLDLKLLDAGVWTGGIFVDARRNGLSAFLSAEGNARKNARVRTASDPFWAGFLPVEWRGTNLEWWAIGGGGAVNLQRNFAVVGGMKIEHLSLRLADPVDPTGIIRDFQAIFGDRYSSDFRTKLWIPYFGIQFDGLNYRGQLLFSPVAWADVTIPFRYLYVDTPFIGFEEARYRFKPSGLWLAADLQYEMRLMSNLGGNLWFKGSWLQIKGRGREGYQLDAVNAGVPLNGLLTDAGSANGKYTTYILAVGVCGTWTF